MKEEQINREGKSSLITVIGLLILGTISIILISCLSADKNITSKNIGCNKINEYNAAICCLQFMSSKTGNDSKDVVCRPLVDELTLKFKTERKKEALNFCSRDFKNKSQRCLDLINPR